jgi:hypothetical protein
MKLLIGSRALAQWVDLNRPIDDWDWIVPSHIVVDSTSEVEYHQNRVFDRMLEAYNGREVMSLNHLFTLKLSHAFWPVRWEKTVYDLKVMLLAGAQVDSYWYQQLYDYWCQFYRNKDHINLRQDNSQFFNARVERQYDHDRLHQLVAYGDKPMYEKIKPNLDSAWCSEKMFNSLEFEEKLQLAREEAYVLALERYIIPQLQKSIKGAYRLAMRDLVTRLSKGWFPYFIMTNWHLLDLPDCDYYAKFKNGI